MGHLSKVSGMQIWLCFFLLSVFYDNSSCVHTRFDSHSICKCIDTIIVPVACFEHQLWCWGLAALRLGSQQHSVAKILKLVNLNFDKEFDPRQPIRDSSIDRNALIMDSEGGVQNQHGEEYDRSLPKFYDSLHICIKTFITTSSNFFLYLFFSFSRTNVKQQVVKLGHRQTKILSLRRTSCSR